MQAEQWKEIGQYAGYSVSSEGRVRNDKTGNVLKQYVTQGRRRQVTILYQGKAAAIHVPRAVLLAFNGPPPYPTYCVAYRDDNRQNVTAANLYWRPVAEINSESSPVRQKLSPEEARTIVARHATGAVSQRALAEEFGISQGTLSMLVNGHTWKEYIDVQ